MRRLRSTPVLMALAALAACTDADVVAPPATGDDAQALNTGIVDPAKGPVRTGWILGEDGRTPVQIGYQVVNGHAIWDGDVGLGPAERIASTPEQVLRARGGAKAGPSLSLHYDGTRWWSGSPAVIPVRRVYNPGNLTAALSQIEQQVPGVDFVPWNGQYHHIVVYYGNGANYYNGCYNGACEIYIGSGTASKQLIMHEFGHGLGFQHEQKRCDRNSYLRMLDANPYAQFAIECAWAELGGYDLNSIMHYNSREFGRLHFTDWSGNEVCGYWCRTTLSPGDVSAWRTLYPAPGAIVVDNNNAANNSARARFEQSGTWQASSGTAGFHGTNYHFASTQAVSDGATFWFYLPAAGTKSIDAWWTSGTNRSATAPYIAYNAAGTEVGRVSRNQQVNGGAWRTLGTWNFSAGWNRVVLSRWTTPGYVVIADAIRVR